MAYIIKVVASTEPALIIQLSRLSKLMYRRAVEETLGMRLKHYVALANLSDHVGVSQQEMSSMLCVDANNLVILLNELEAAGLALRRRDPNDRRRHLVDITPQGRQSLEKAERSIAEIEDQMLSGLSTEERTSLHRMLAKAIESATVEGAEIEGAAMDISV